MPGSVVIGFRNLLNPGDLCTKIPGRYRPMHSDNGVLHREASGFRTSLHAHVRLRTDDQYFATSWRVTIDEKFNSTCSVYGWTPIKKLARTDSPRGSCFILLPSELQLGYACTLLSGKMVPDRRDQQPTQLNTLLALDGKLVDRVSSLCFKLPADFNFLKSFCVRCQKAFA